MKKYIILIILILLCQFIVKAQVSRIVADSTVMSGKIGGYNELTIKNSSMNVSGFAYNVGGGRFRYIATTLNTMADLESIAAQSLSSPLLITAYHVKGFYNVNDNAGGDFILIDTTGASAVPGMVMPVGSTKAYVRMVGNARSFNIKWFGAIGAGMASFKQDSTALSNANKFFNIIKGGSLKVPGTKDFYGYRGDGLLLCDNMEIYGDGDASEIRNVDPQMGTVQKGVIFYTGTYDPSNSNGIYKARQFPFLPQSSGTNWVKLFNANDTLNLWPGKVVLVTARKRFKSFLKQYWRASEIVAEEIWKRSADTIFFKHNLQEDYLAGGISSGSGGIDSTYPRILDVNSGLTSRGSIGTDRVTKNINIHDLYLSQADYNMVDNLPYDQSKVPVNVIGFGSTYESKFENLTLKSFGTFGGNLYNYCSIHNIKIVSTKKVFDFGYGSTNNFIHDIDWIYYPSSYSDTTGEKSFVYFDDDFHHNNVYNINVSGAQDKLDFMKIGRGAHNNKIYNWNFNLPMYNDTSTNQAGVNTAFNWFDDTGYVTHDNFVSDISINVDTLGQWIDYEGVSTNTRVLNNVIQNITFRGKIRNVVGKAAVNLAYAGNMILKNIYFEDGNTFRVQGGDSIIMTGMYGPTMNQTVSGTFPIKANINNVFKSSQIGAPNYLTPSVIAPVTPTQGVFYYDSTQHNFYGYNGTSWIQLGGGVTNYVEQALPNLYDSWADGTPPAGTRTASYGWQKVGNVTTLWMNIRYTTAGVSNTTVNITIPADVPLAVEGSVFNTTNDIMRSDYAKITTTAGTTNAQSSTVSWIKTGTGAYQLKVSTSPLNARCLWLRITYPSQ